MALPHPHQAQYLDLAGRSRVVPIEGHSPPAREALCWHTVKLHKGEGYGPVHVAFGYNNINGEFWAIVSDEPTTLHTFQEYGLRFDIEEAFLDDQSNG